MATYIADLAASGVQPRALHAGVQMAYATYTTASGTLSVGDVIQMLKIPDGAKIVGGFLKFNAIAGSTVAQINLGTRTDTDGLVVSATGNAAKVIAFTGDLMGNNQTVTDAASTRHTMVEALIGGTSLTGTGTISIEACVMWQMEVE